MAAQEDLGVEHQESEAYCLKWKNHQSNVTSRFNQHLQNGLLVDVTLVCGGFKLKAHRLVLSVCSSYFQEVLTDINPGEYPVIIMNKDINYPDLEALIAYMYCGEVSVVESKLRDLLMLAETLQIRGLCDFPEGHILAGVSKGEPLVCPVSYTTDQSSVRREQPASPEQAPERRSSSPSPPAPQPAANIAPDSDIRPAIAEMIREEERARMLEGQPWFGPSTSTGIVDSYQYQLQSMWQKCWNTNQNLVHNLRFRERGPLKSWRPETMAEAIFSVLKEGLSLSQAARKYDIPYPTFVLYANRVHNMLGPSADGGADLRPKGRGRPQRILLGVWPDEHIRSVIRAVVFRDTHTPHPNAHHMREIDLPAYPAITDGAVTPNAYAPMPCGNGRDERVSPTAAAAAAVAAVAHGLRRQMCNMVAAAQRPPDQPTHLGLPSLPLQSPRLPSPISSGLESPLCSPLPPGHALEPPKLADPFRPFVSPRSDIRDHVDSVEMGPPKNPMPARNGQPTIGMELDGDDRGDI